MATLYLSPSGNDSTGNGTQGNPWKNISKILSAGSNGDSVIMAAGTYTFEILSWGTKNFTFTGATSNGVPTTIIDGGASGNRWQQGTTVVSFTNLIIQNLIIPASYQTIIYSDATTSNWTFTNCKFKTIQTGNYGQMGGVFGGSNSGSSGNATYTFNTCEFNDITGGIGGAGGKIFAGYSGLGLSNLYVNMTNCTTYCGTSGGNALTNIFDVSTATFTTTIKNCIFSNVTGGTITWGGQASGSSYSDFYNITSSPSGTGVITSDPKFVDPANGNFSLRPTSNCIDSGVLI